MNRQIDNKAVSYGLTHNTLKNNPDILAAIPALGDDYVLFETLFNKLKEAMKDFELLMSGKNAEKAKAETALLDAIQPVKDKLKSYASKQDGEALKELAAETPTSMKAMRDPEFLRYATEVLNTAKNLSEELKRTNMRPEMITRLEAAIKVFDEKMKDRDESQNSKSNVGETMPELEAKIDTLLKDSIDSLVKSEVETYPAFYAAYFATRTVHDHGIRHRKPVEPPAPPTPPAEG